MLPFISFTICTLHQQDPHVKVELLQEVKSLSIKLKVTDGAVEVHHELLEVVPEHNHLEHKKLHTLLFNYQPQSQRNVTLELCLRISVRIQARF